jgi:hypothetical protein
MAVDGASARALISLYVSLLPPLDCLYDRCAASHTNWQFSRTSAALLIEKRDACGRKHAAQVAVTGFKDPGWLKKKTMLHGVG